MVEHTLGKGEVTSSILVTGFGEREVKEELALREIVEYLSQYNCRHTSLGLCVGSVISIPEIAQWVGNTQRGIVENGSRCEP